MSLAQAMVTEQARVVSRYAPLSVCYTHDTRCWWAETVYAGTPYYGHGDTPGAARADMLRVLRQYAPGGLGCAFAQEAP